MGAPLQSEHKPETRSHNRFILIGSLAILFLLAFYYLYRPGPENIVTDQKKLNWDDVAFIDEQGELQLKEWRTQDLERQLQELEQAEQYVLLARTDGAYICYDCSSGTCFLKKGMVWKYGVTRKGVSNRYPGEWLSDMRLGYIVQVRGTVYECLIEEKQKIFLYPLHLDNQIRKPVDRMARPPGNKNDN